jgi:hypothetical protein
MAKANSTITFCGVTFSRDENFGPITLGRMFGKNLPRHFRIARDGSVPIAIVIRYIKKQGEIGLQMMQDESDIMIPR